MTNYQGAYRNWIIGLGDTGQGLIGEMAANTHLAGSSVCLAVIKIGDSYQNPPQGVDHLNYLVLESASRDRKGAQEALLRDMRSSRPRVIRRLRDILKTSDQKNVVWLVGSFFEAQVTGMIFDLAHITNRIGHTPGHQISHIFWVLTASNGTNNAQPAAVLQEIHRLTEHGDSGARYYPYRSSENDDSLMPHTDKNPDEDITDVILCIPPADPFGRMNEDALRQRLALTLLELTRDTTFEACNLIWSSHKKDRRQRMSEKDDLYVTGFGVYVNNIPVSTLSQLAAAYQARDLLVGRTNQAANPGLFGLMEYKTLRLTSDALKNDFQKPGAELNFLSHLAEILNEEIPKTGSQVHSLGYCLHYLVRLRDDLKKAPQINLRLRNVVTDAIEVIEGLSQLKGSLNSLAMQTISATEDRLDQLQSSLFDGGMWDSDALKQQAKQDTWLTETQKEELKNGFSFYWKQSGGQLVLIIRIGQPSRGAIKEIECKHANRQNIWDVSFAWARSFYEVIQLDLDQLPKGEDDQLPQIRRMVNEGSRMLLYDDDERIEKRIVILGGTENWKKRWAAYLGTDPSDKIAGPANRGVILQIHKMIPLSNVWGLKKMWDDYSEKKEQIADLHLFEPDRLSAVLKIRAQKYADSVNKQLSIMRDKRLSHQTIALFEGNETSDTSNRVISVEWLAQAWLRGILKERRARNDFRIDKQSLPGLRPWDALHAWLTLSDQERAAIQARLNLLDHPVRQERVMEAIQGLSGSTEEVDWSIIIFATLSGLQNSQL
jgi:hypothetical protein